MNKVLILGDTDCVRLTSNVLKNKFDIYYEAMKGMDLVIFAFDSDSKIDEISSSGLDGYNIAYVCLFNSVEDFVMINTENSIPYISFSKSRLQYYAETLEIFVTICLKRIIRSNPSLPKCPDLSTPRSVLPPLYGKDGKTDFPKKGMDDEICFENSQFEMFPLELALDIAKSYPKAWCSGGNHFGNKAFNYWIRTMKAYEEGRDIPKDCQRWLKKRERYIARHKNDFRLAGVVAMIKWAGFVNIPKGKNKGKGVEDGSSLTYMLSLFKDKK